MKQVLKIAIVILCIINKSVYAQAGMMNNNPDKSAALDISATNKGLLIPRISLQTTEDKTVINGNDPAQSLMVFNTNSSISGIDAMGEGFYYWDKTVLPNGRWKRVVTTLEGAWTLAGNSNGVLKALGTTDVDGTGKGIELPFIVNSQEQIRIMQGKSGINLPDAQKKSSLGIKFVPGGGDEDNELVLRNGQVNSNEVFQKDPLISKTEFDAWGQSQGYLVVKKEFAYQYYGRTDTTHVMDMLYVRFERGGVYANAVFSCQQSPLNNNQSIVLTFLGGGIEPIKNAYKNGYVATNLPTGTVANGYQSNQLRLTYPNAPTPYGVANIFDFDIWITVEGGKKYVNFVNRCGLFPNTNNETNSLYGAKRYYLIQQRVY